MSRTITQRELRNNSAAVMDAVEAGETTLAELAAGLHTIKDPAQQGARLHRLQVVEANFDALPFDAAAAKDLRALGAAVTVLTV